MYPYLPGPAAAASIATVMHERDLADAAARGNAARRQYQARRNEHAVVPALPVPERHRVRRRLLGVAHVHLHRHPSAIH